jgi:hypothetical protein
MRLAIQRINLLVADASRRSSVLGTACGLVAWSRKGSLRSVPTVSSGGAMSGEPVPAALRSGPKVAPKLSN